MKRGSKVVIARGFLRSDKVLTIEAFDMNKGYRIAYLSDNSWEYVDNLDLA